jgi:hypothetical protein
MSTGLGREDIRALLDDLSAELAARGTRAELLGVVPDREECRACGVGPSIAARSPAMMAVRKECSAMDSGSLTPHSHQPVRLESLSSPVS